MLTLPNLLLVVALVLFIVEAIRGRSLMAAGLACWVLHLLIRSGSAVVRAAAVVLVLVTLGCGSSGCATTGGGGIRHQATTGVVVAHSTLAAIQDTEMALVCGRPTAPQPPACVPAELHKQISASLAEAFEYDAQAARLVRDIPEGAPTPLEALTLVGRIGAIVAKILGDLPKSPQRDQLAASLGVK